MLNILHNDDTPQLYSTSSLKSSAEILLGKKCGKYS